MCLRCLSSLFNPIIRLSFNSYSFALRKRFSLVRADLDLTNSNGQHDGWESCTIQ